MTPWPPTRVASFLLEASGCRRLIRTLLLRERAVVRPATMDDAAELCRLNSAPGMTQAEFAEGLKGELAGGARFVALTRDTVIGTATVTLLGGGRWGIDGVWVKPLYRHQGLGRSLCAAILDHVKTRKGEAVTLSVNRRAWAALALYREMGFHVVESSGDESTMEKRL